MYFKIRNSLGTAALALIIAVMSSQTAIALLPLDAETADNSGGAIPNEISLNDANDDNSLLAPPMLNDNSEEGGLDALPHENDNEDVAIPLDGQTPEHYDLNSPQDDFNNQPMENINAGLGNNGSLSNEPSPLTPGGVQPLGGGNVGLGGRPQAITPESNNFGEGILSQVDNELFSQMSDIEKQTSLLTLELRREKIKNEIAAIKAARQKAVDDLREQEQEKERKRIEWEKEQERKQLIEEQKLKALSITLEKLRQESIVNAYKEQMLHTNQKWIDNNSRLYVEIMKGEEENEKIIRDFKVKFEHLAKMAAKAADVAETAKKNYGRELANLQTQISILKSRLEAEKVAREEEVEKLKKKNKDKDNPFASSEGGDGNDEEKMNQKLSDKYAIMEISGKGDSLMAKLINKSGSSFVVQKGTVLQSGHTVDEISQTYIRADKDGSKDYLYFVAGGVLDREPVKPINIPLPKSAADNDDKDGLSPLPGLNISEGLPSLREGMFIR